MEADWQETTHCGRAADLSHSSLSPQLWTQRHNHSELDFVVISTERGSRTLVPLLAREGPEGLEYVGGRKVTLRQPDRDRFWELVQRELLLPALPIKPRKATAWLQSDLKCA